MRHDPRLCQRHQRPPRRQTAAEGDLARNDRRTIVGARWEHDLGSATTWRTQATFDSRVVNQPTSATPFKGTLDSYNLTSDITARGTLAGMDATGFVQLFYNYLDNQSYSFNKTPGGRDGFGALAQTICGDIRNAGARARVELALTPRLQLIAGVGGERSVLRVRQTAYAYPLAATPVPTLIPADRRFWNVAPEASLAWRLGDALRLHARVATGYGIPQAGQLFVTPQGTFGNNVDLRSQRNVGVDLGAEVTLGDNLSAEVTGYQEWFRGELVSQSAGVNLQTYTSNVPRSTHRGVEVGLDWRPLPALLPGGRLRASYSYNDQYYTSFAERLTNGAASVVLDRRGNAIPGVIPHFLNARASYDQQAGALAGLGGFVELTWRSAYPIDNANLLRVPGYRLVNLDVHYHRPGRRMVVANQPVRLRPEPVRPNLCRIGGDRVGRHRGERRRQWRGGAARSDRGALRRPAANGDRRHPVEVLTMTTAYRPAYRIVWRWHFYAGLLCLPFVLWLSLTGGLYLFRPQVEALIDRPYARVVDPAAPRRTPAAIAAAAVAAVPGATLHRFQLPETPTQAVQVIVGRGAGETRVYVHPASLAILKTVGEQDRLMRVVLHLHGELLAGDTGSYVVELAASWAIVMIGTGLFLWWPRGQGPAGVVWPRFHARGRRFWRDLHGVTGFWVSGMALVLLISGLPWAKSWGSYLAAVAHRGRGQRGGAGLADRRPWRRLAQRAGDRYAGDGRRPSGTWRHGDAASGGAAASARPAGGDAGGAAPRRAGAGGAADRAGPALDRQVGRRRPAPAQRPDARRRQRAGADPSRLSAAAAGRPAGRLRRRAARGAVVRLGEPAGQPPDRRRPVAAGGQQRGAVVATAAGGDARRAASAARVVARRAGERGGGRAGGRAGRAAAAVRGEPPPRAAGRAGGAAALDGGGALAGPRRSAPGGRHLIATRRRRRKPLPATWLPASRTRIARTRGSNPPASGTGT